MGIQAMKEEFLKLEDKFVKLSTNMGQRDREKKHVQEIEKREQVEQKFQDLQEL
jgi:hypothetical protein